MGGSTAIVRWVDSEHPQVSSFGLPQVPSLESQRCREDWAPCGRPSRPDSTAQHVPAGPAHMVQKGIKSTLPAFTRLHPFEIRQKSRGAHTVQSPKVSQLPTRTMSKCPEQTLAWSCRVKHRDPCMAKCDCCKAFRHKDPAHCWHGPSQAKCSVHSVRPKASKATSRRWVAAIAVFWFE